jgi:fumarate reductase subunit D
MKRTNDFRARNHPAYWAFLVHRFSGLALALFLPVHFWALGHAIEGEASLNGFIAITDQPLFKFGEWGLVILLAAHMAGGIRLLLIEFGRWTGLRKDLIAVTAGFAAVTGMAFALALVF